MTASEGFQGIVNDVISLRIGTEEIIKRSEAAETPEEGNIDEGKIFDWAGVLEIRCVSEEAGKSF